MRPRDAPQARARFVSAVREAVAALGLDVAEDLFWRAADASADEPRDPRAAWEPVIKRARDEAVFEDDEPGDPALMVRPYRDGSGRLSIVTQGLNDHDAAELLRAAAAALGEVDGDGR